MLPMQQPELALAELERAAKLPGMRGVMMATAINGRNLDEKAFFPIYAKCEELGWPIFTHPVAPLGGERMSKYYLSNLLGNPVEIGIAGYSLFLAACSMPSPSSTSCCPAPAAMCHGASCGSTARSSG